MESEFRKTHETFVPGSMTLPQEYYTSPEIFSKEKERIFRGWVCAGHVSRIPDAGSYFLLDQAPDNLIVLRDKEGGVRAFHNVCRHRGTRVEDAPEGMFSNSIQCSYHAWTYGLDGKLIGAPFMKDVDGFNPENFPLKAADVHQWNGFIFVNTGGGKTASFEQEYPGLTGRMSQWNMGALKSHKRIPYEVKSNWKYVFQNFNECYHCPTLHPALNKLADYTSGNNDLTEGSALGGFIEFTEDSRSMTMTGRTCAIPLGDLSPEDSRRGYYYSVLPNLLLNVHPDYVMFHLVSPQAPDRTKVISEWLFNPEANSKKDFRPEDAIEFWDITNIQDWNVCELGQKGVSSPAYEPGPYSPRESLLAAFDQHYLSIMNSTK
ncbi:MAG TPA: aromatic ring-hydroxylating dioxygenase subunit alpha [Patescibacteria group bacterium]|nr:aromatic ring-hydroxylating dioxygenase subunit alpha [Patescibacteria group bacterium]